MKLKVPFYKQTSDNRCTAASLLMALVFFKKLSKLSKNIEIKLCKDIKFPNRYNVAITAQKYGLIPIIRTNVKGIEIKKWLILNKTPIQEIKLYSRAMKISRKNAKNLKIKEQLTNSISISDIARVLKNKGLVLINVNAKFLGHEEVPHMVVITGLNKNRVRLNDPLSNNSTIVGIKTFNKAKNFYGEQTMIGLYKRD